MNYGEYTLKTPAQIKREEERIKLQEHTKLINEQKENNIRRRANYDKFIVESKNFLVVEAMNKLLLNCLPESIDNHLRDVARNCCETFVREEGVNNILKGCKSTLFLNEFAIILEDTHKKVVHGAANSKEDTFEISNSTMKGYYDKLSSMNYGPMCNAIIDRVTDAEKEFIESNIKDKSKMEDAAEKAAEKIGNIKARDEESEEKIKEEFAIMLNNDINNITNRKRNILESIIKRLGEAVVVNESQKDNFIMESGKLDSHKVIDTAEVMYTFLEMVNTCNIKKVDKQYIESVLSSIK